MFPNLLEIVKVKLSNVEAYNNLNAKMDNIGFWRDNWIRACGNIVVPGSVVGNHFNSLIGCSATLFSKRFSFKTNFCQPLQARYCPTNVTIEFEIRPWWSSG